MQETEQEQEQEEIQQEEQWQGENLTETEKNSDNSIDEDSGSPSLESSFNFLKNIFKLKSAQADDMEEGNEGIVKDGDLQELGESIIFSDFSIPLIFEENEVVNVMLRSSMAGISNLSNTKLQIKYSFGDDWQSLISFNLQDGISNSKVEDYFNLNIPFNSDVNDFSNLKVKVTYLSKDFEAEIGQFFLDAIWLEVGYDESEIEDGIEKNEEKLLEDDDDEEELDNSEDLNNFYLETITNKKIFKTDELPEIEFVLKKKRKLLAKIGAGLKGLIIDEYKDTVFKTKLISPDGNFVDEKIQISTKYLKNGKFRVNVDKLPRRFSPGVHHLKIELRDVAINNGRPIYFSQDFIWGVLALNTSKSIYSPEEKAYLQMAVLNDKGDTICDADLKLEITAPDGGVAILSSKNGLIIYNEECGPNNVINSPDYYSYYNLAGVGTYNIKLTALTENGEYEISDSFEVRDNIPFDIERIGPTRIYPWADYDMQFRIIPKYDFRGIFTEYLPDDFMVVEQKNSGANVNLKKGKNLRDGDGEQKIIWKVNWKAGEEYILSYSFDAPNISPEFYLLGPSDLKGYNHYFDEEGEFLKREMVNFAEIRKWQIASDALQEFSSSGTFDVPAGVTEITVKAWGAGGGGGGCDRGTPVVGGDGGGGGFITGTISVTPLETLTIDVGTGGSGGTGGSNQGGDGGGGGGYSALRRGSNYLFVAGAGGGGGGSDDNSSGAGDAGGAGGAGGGTIGADGIDSGNGDAAPGGAGGTQLAGGAGGDGPDDDGSDGSSLTGGDGGGDGGAGTAGGSPGGGDGGDNNGAGDDMGGGGGGGAGWYGGGGGANYNDADPDGAAGGGGGSSWATTSATSVSNIAGSGTTAASSTDSNYADSAGAGGTGGQNNNDAGNAGNSGRVVILYDIPPKDITVSATGTQKSTLNVNSDDNYLGATFVFTENNGTSTVSSISINELGTVDAQNDLSNIRLYYDLDNTAPYNCLSESYGSGDNQFGATSSSFDAVNGTSTFSDLVDVSTTSSMCVYVVLDIGSGAEKDETIEIEITNPSTSVVLSSGTVEPATSVALSGTTNLYSPDALAIANEQRESDDFTTIANHGWTNEDQIVLSALAQEMGATTSKFDYYFELLDDSGSFISATSAPSSSCVSGTAYGDCSSKIWFASASTTEWYDNNWKYRKKITVNANQTYVSATNFVILATTTDSDLMGTSSGGHVEFSDGDDILLIDDDGSSVLDYEREYYDETSGELVFWVETDISSTTNKTFYLYYGNANIASDQQNVSGTWDGDYTLVNHLNDDPGPGGSGDIEDSTSNSNDATAASGMTSDDLVNAKLGLGIDFDGVSDTLTVPDSTSMDGATGNGQARTYSYWLNFTTVVENTLITDKSNFAGNGLWSEAHASPNKIRGGTDSGNQLVSETTFATGEWYYIVFEHDGSYDRLYVNGVLDDGPNAQTADNDNNNSWQIMGSGNNYEVNGVLDELRITNVSHSADWIKTEYSNQNNVKDFLSFGVEENIDGASYEAITNIISIPDRGSISNSSLGYKWQVLVCNDSDNCSFWDNFNSSFPNFKIDTASPSAPGNLSLATSTHTSITINFGAESSDTNFYHYKIFYKAGISGVDTIDTEHTDNNLNYIDYNSSSTTTISSLVPGTQYVINIWAYDMAGNKTGATELIVTTKTAPHARARSVQFLAGDYSANGSSGQLSDTDQTFSSFNFSLAETDVEIKNAYILFEAQFAAYYESSGDYIGYNLAFDSCPGSCTADAFSGSGRILKDDNNILVYDETESNQVRLLLDVTDEVQLASYAGDGSNIEAQVGYRLETGVATTSIASAKAILIINYSFNDDDSSSITNTVIYPLESTDSGDSGSRQAVQTNACTKDSDCALFDYDMEIPEFTSKLSQWFQVYGVNDSHGEDDVIINVNIEGTNIDSDTFVHESVLAGTQGNLPQIIFDSVSGFSENSSQSLEYYLNSSGGGNYYILGGEVVETYTALKSASTKTRTVSFPIGVITNGNSTTAASGTVNVYFPENGTGSGLVDIKKAWFRVLGDNYNSGSYNLSISSKVGDNSQSGNYAYNLNAGSAVVKPAFKVIHLIPSSDYSELELANKNTTKTVTLYTTNSSADMGGVSAELMITYTYTDESSGYLSSLSLYGGQSDIDANSHNETVSASKSVFPELKGTKTLRAADLLGSFLLSESSASMVSDWFSLDMNIATNSPSCSTSSVFTSHSDNRNSFSEFYKDVSSLFSPVDDQQYYVCMANYNSGDDLVGAKMNTIWNYTYQWDASPPKFTQKDWRWYENIDGILPINPKAAAKTKITKVNLGEALRIRINLGLTDKDLATSTKTFKLQFALGSDCTSISSSTWEDVGNVGGSEAWTGYNNPDPDDDTTLGTYVLSLSSVAESYEEVNPSASNPKGASDGAYLEWDWSIYNNSASSSSDYCFRMIGGDDSELDDYLSDSYPFLSTAAANTAPNIPNSLEQYKSDDGNTISNLSWINKNNINLEAEVLDPNISELLTLYFELASSTGGTFTTATSVPSSVCISGTAYADCSSKIWIASSTLGDYRVNAFKATTSINSISESSSGYKWQVMACDDDGDCSSWNDFNPSIPNFKIDTTPPSAPGNLSFSTSTPTSITLSFGASSVESNFDTYKIFYQVGSSGVDENDNEHNDTNLTEQDYNGESVTVVNNLAADTTYVFNIWAYDLAGNKATATTEVVATTTQSFNPPTGYINPSTAQKTDGSGTVDVTILADDPDNNDTLRAKLFYEAGNSCAFSSVTNITVDESDENIAATYGDPDVDNSSYYQVGTSTSWIITSPGANYVIFDWFSAIDLPDADGQYCLGLVVNDGSLSQVATHTKVLTLDNVDPVVPGALSLGAKNYSSITLDFGSESSDTNFKEYKIFYKEGTSGLSESDSEWNQSNDSNLASVNYGAMATTTITGLIPNTTYVFNIWAYDDYGNKASSSVEFSIKTNAAPINISADNQYLSDGSTLVTNNSWIDENNLMFKASVHDQDAGDLISFYFELVSATGTFSTISVPPSSSCASGTSYMSCSNKMWISTTTVSILPSDWYNEDWLYRKKITLDASKISTTVSDFPVFIETTDNDLSDYARSDGFDILFTNSSGTTTLDYERESYDNSSGKLAVWLKADISSTTDTVLYMYYGNSGSNTDQATTTGVWDSNYKGVWHLEENVIDESNQDAIHKDSSSNNNDGDQYGNNEVSGILDQGQSFDGLNDYIEIDDDNSLDFTDALTVSFWINGDVDSPSASSSVYTSSGSDSFVVPDGVTEITVKMWGGGGGGGAGIDGGGTQNVNNGGHGGGAGFTEGTISVTPGEILDIVVGGGGGGGQIGASSNGGGGGGGGGRSEIKRSSAPLIVAGGGGGGGGANDRTYAAGSDGGAGGGLNGVDGTDSGSTVAGGGATQSTGGAAGTGTNDAQAGSSEAGGDGADGRNGQGTDGSGASGGAGGGGDGGLGDVSNRYPGGGGGGSGYYGGGGGGEQSSNYNAGAGAGGGSSYLSSSLSSTSTEAGSGRDAGNNSDSDYSNSVGQGGTGGSPGVAGTAGDDGYVLISFTPGTNIFEKGDAYKLSIDYDSNNIYGMINSQAVKGSFSSAWHYIDLTYNRNAGGTDELKLFIDGVLSDSADFSELINTNSSAINIGSLFDGKIDEIRLSNTVRDSGWIKTEYNNQSNVSDFLDFSSQSTVTSYFESVLSVNIPDNPDYSSGYKWQVMACDDDNDCTTWDQFNVTTPNFKIDTTNPSSPGALSLNSRTSNSITLDFGAQTDEDNFTEYKIYYATSSTLSESDNLHSSSTDSDLAYVDYNGTSNTTINGLDSDITYYFNIYAYDIVGHKSSSSVVSISTISASSSPGVLFYTKNTRVLYYRVWDGNSWGSEQSGPTLGSGSGDNIRHIRTVRSDDGGKVALLIKTWDGTNQEWWASVYRYAANDFVNSSQLGSAYASSDNNQLITSCISALSSGEFMIIRNNNGSIGTLIYSWNNSDGWSSEGAGPDPGEILNACELIRRPNTDNYLLMTYDDARDVGSAYYYGGSTYSSSWSSWIEHSSVEEDADNYVGQAFFDASDNTRGGISYSNSASNNYAYLKYFTVSDNSINYGGAVAGPSSGGYDWGNDFVHGEFAVDPSGTGIAYYLGRDTGGELNIYQTNVSNPIVSWATTTNGDNISATNLYSQNNYSQKPFAITFYKGGEGVVAWNDNSSATPKYRVIKTSANNLDSSDTAVSGADANNWTRVRFYDDPSENEFIAIYQNNDVDYAAVFWDATQEKFYSSGNQSWNELVTASGAFDQDDENTSFAYTAYNSPPNSLVSLEQYKSDASTTIANQGWTNETSVKFEIKATDPDTYEIITLYLNLVLNTDDLNNTSNESNFNACASTTSFSSCSSKIWAIASSSADDYSLNPFTATATIISLASSTIGYKWQAIACDDEGDCSSWSAFNTSRPNFYVDDLDPSIPGNLSDIAVNSNSVTLEFGSASTEDNFDAYKIFYKIGASGLSEADSAWTEVEDSNLGVINYGGASETTITGLSSSTQYVFNIWAYDLAGNTASGSIEVSTTTSALPNIVQTSYLLENDDGENVNSNSAEVSASTTLTNVNLGQRINVRIQIENNGGDISADKVYKLQFDTDYDNNWIDVGASTALSYSLGISGTSNNTISSAKAESNSNNWSDGAWYEATNLSSSYSLTNNYYTELVFAIESSQATTSTTYRLRLYNNTDNKSLNAYSNYPTLSTVATETKKYSKDVVSSLASTKDDLEYYFDAEGYADTNADDSIYDKMSSFSQIPVYNFVSKHSNNSDAITLTWNGQSTYSPAFGNVFLQVYRFGSTNAWETLDTENSAGADTDFSLTTNINSKLSEYYDSNNYVYFRVYQESGTQDLKTDYYNISFSSPVSEAKQIHYRWRADDGDEENASWLESEDTGSPTNGSSIGVGSTTRLRIEVVNIGGGTASNYNYRLEYASSSDACASNFGTWTTVPVTATANEHFEMVNSSYFDDASSTSAQFTNSESYTFISGDMIEDPSNSSLAITLNEDRYTELEYVFDVTTDAQDAMTYCFRISNSGTLIDNYDVYPALTLSGNTNTAPTFSVDPSDDGSASTTPTNYGDNISFSATAGDAEGDSYYLAICKTDSINPNSNSAPTCGGGSWCISGATASGTEATCDYIATSSTESLAWYAFVCDKVSGFGISKCSSASQGSGDILNDSPFVINHPPSFSAVATTDDNKNPGETFVITATVVDTDTAGSPDTMDLFICTKDSAAAGVGCTGSGNTQLCSELATSSPNASCSFLTSVPSEATSTPYYAFVFDSHNLASDDNSRDSTYTINNVASTLGALSLNGGSDITLFMNPSTTTVSSVNTSVVDQNGCSTIVSSVGKVYMSNVSGGYNCTADNNNCYHASINDCTITCTNSTTASISCSVDLEYYAVPTDDSSSNPNEPYDWMSYLQVYDGENYSIATSSGVEVLTTLALDLNNDLINFGTGFAAGENTGTDNATTTVINVGNSPMDTRIKGTDLNGNPSGTITVDNIKYNLTNFDYELETNNLSSSDQTVNTNTPRATSSININDEIFWGIGIPFGSDASTYYGQNTFTVQLDTSDWN